jgi:hypothetical protein
MDIASSFFSSGMITVFYGGDAKLGLATSAAKKWVEERHGIENPVCNTANFLCEGAKAIGGHTEVGLSPDLDTTFLPWPSKTIFDPLTWRPEYKYETG